MDWASWHCTNCFDGDQNHPKEKEMQKGKMVVWGGLTNTWAKKRSERQKRKGKIYHLNAEFHRIPRRDKKAFVSEQCKEIDKNNRMRKTRDLFKKIRNINRTFHAKTGTIKDRNDTDLTEAEDIKSKWQKYTELYTRKSLNDPITTMVWSLT